MQRRRFGLLIAAAMAASVAPARANSAFPTRTVRIVVPYSVGFGPDIVARTVGQYLAQHWKQPVVIENRPGASGIVALSEVRRVPADGHTLFVADAGTMSANPLLHASLPYDVADFAPVSTLFNATFVIWVRSESRFKTLQDLLREARAQPARVSYASLGNGHPSQLAIETMARAAEVDFLHVPFREVGSMFAAISNGDVDFTVVSTHSAAPLVKAGKLRPLAVAARNRLPDYPDIPTLPQAGGPPVLMQPWAALVGVAGTPQPVLDEIHRAVTAALRDPEIRARIEAIGFDVLPSSPQELAARIRHDAEVYAPLVQSGRVRTN
jgi:tripartite-type tricarboxylate transporter receptor subunit TctC